MKIFKIGCLVALFVSFLVVIPTVASAANNDASKVELTLKEGKKIIDDKGDDKDNIYTPKPAKIVKVLPTTGEVITSFIYIILGLSVLLFLFGIFIIKMTNNDIRWEY